MVPLEKLKVFYYVSKTGGTLQASKVLKITQPAVSKQVTLLEKALGVKLFNRTHRGLRTTKQGEILSEAADKVFKELEMTENLIKNEHDEPFGLLRITTTWGFANAYLSQVATEFMEENPKIQLSISGTDVDEDFNFSKADILIRPFRTRESNIHYRRLMRFRFKLYAHESYVKKYGAPKSLEELDNHRLLAYDTHVPHPYSAANWHLTAGTHSIRTPFISINSSYAAYKLAKRGMGIISLNPEFPAVKRGKLIPILPNESGSEVEIDITYPKSLSRSKKTLTFVDFLENKFKNYDFDDE